MLQEQLGVFSWSCITCNEQNDYYLKKCPYCGSLKEQFCKPMRTDCIQLFKLDASNYNKDFQKLGIIDFVCNQSEDRKEILELLIAKIKLSESEHSVISSKQLIVKPYFIPLIQNPEYCSITQEQADNGVTFIDTFKYLDADIFIFESKEKAEIYLNQCNYYNIQCPITKYIELKRVFPNSNGQLTVNGMLKVLKIPFDSECFSLAEIVNELLDRSFRFDIEMIQTLSFPIPEEEKRIQGFDNIVVLDFEATCQRENNKKYNQEIIEFPAQIYNVSNGVVTKTFWRYVRPVEDPILSDFCTELTGITQDLVDNGVLLEQALNEFIEFIKGLGRYCILTCGDYDLHLLKKETTRKNIDIPKGLKFYINIKKVFPKHLRDPQCVKDPCMVEMLELCGLDLQGRHHSGIDDVKNITRIVDYLITTQNFRFDERMLSYTFKV